MIDTGGQLDPEDGSSRCPAGGQPFPNLDTIASKADEQSTSLFLSQLPIELRNAIYRLLWRDAGLEQHILADKDYDPELASAKFIWKRRRTVPETPTTRFSHMACISDHSAFDDRQEELAKLIPDGLESDDDDEDEVAETWGERLNNAWGNHWKCEEAHQAVVQIRPAKPRQRSPFLSMMLVCRKMYLECRESIYRELTFVIHDPVTLHSFLIARRLPIVDEIRRINLSIRLPILSDVTCLKAGEADLMARWRTSCQALSEARSLVSVSLWLETVGLENDRLLNTVPAVSPFVFDSRLASILTVDIPANPSRPEVWKDVAAIEPAFRVRARGFPRYFTEPRWPSVIYRREDGAEPGDPRPQSYDFAGESVLIRVEPLRRIR
ncbi:hypothetical protein PG985_000788 [Apiospora marii]|uniref:DUF7730 domain-containing protein n=1 Tax=Apiospora marii TaxID=335849 RepID=A0ABR1R403_9PEZI